ncbi:MAG TPA: Ppx/GppA phosphatase family protein [Pyrinomonadaceae bacterium]|jgi:exopolyphosphatase/guanosine-5'-triphosphate,3'-diphosphate pyrophosphatase
MKTQTIAAIDIGSNSLKLVIVKASASDSFMVILQERERVRLGHETLKTHQLSDEAINLSADAISKFRSIAETRNADVILAVATASVREAENAAHFVNEIERRTGVRIQVLSSLEEARLIGIAAAQKMSSEKTSLLNVDIGGGSTELSLMAGGEPQKLFSMKLGAVGLTEKFILNNPPKPKEIKNLRVEIARALEKPSKELNRQKWELSTGTSGTILNLAQLLNALSSGAANQKPVIELKKLSMLNEKLAEMTVEERAALPIISPQRAEVIVAGSHILEGVMDALKISILQPCSFALREGVIIDYLNLIEAESLPPVPDVEDKRLRDVFAVGRRFGYNENHALHIANLAEKIFDTLAPVYKLQRHWRTLLSAAALLHEVGYHISHESYHKHSLYLIKNADMTGFSETEKLIIANIARYHKGSMPKEKHADFMILSEKDRATVLHLGAILRLADAIDRDYAGKTDELRFRCDKEYLYLILARDKSFEIEMPVLEVKKDMLEAAFGCKIKVVGNYLENRA